MPFCCNFIVAIKAMQTMPNTRCIIFLFIGILSNCFAQQKKDSLTGISLREVIVTEDSIISVGIEKMGVETIFKAQELKGFELDSLQKSLRWQKMGLNAYGINTGAFNLIDAIKYRLPGVQRMNPATGLVQLRVASSINNTRSIPLFVVDGQQFEIPAQAVQDAQQRGIPLWNFYPPIAYDDIVDVQVLNSLAETVRYGQLGNAGVIVITTKNAKKKKEIQGRTVISGRSTSDAPFFDNPEIEGPVFPGCAAGNDNKACFKASIQKFVEQRIQLPEGKKITADVRVYLQIYIDAYGNLSDYRARTTAGMELLAKEALRVVKTLPKMQPAIKDGKFIGIPYSFLVTFSPALKKRK